MTLTLFTAAGAAAAKLALWILLLVFGVQTYRKFELRSLRWLAIYLVLSAVLGLVMPLVMRRTGEAMTAGNVPFGWTSGELWQVWNYSHMLTSELALLVLGILLLADVASLLFRVGEAQGRLLNNLLAVHARNTPWGIAMLILILSIPALTLTFYLNYA